MQQRNGFRALTGIGLVVATPVVALGTWVVVTGAGGRQLQADAGGQATSVSPVQVAIVSTVAAIVGMLLLVGLVRRLRRGRLVWGVTACGILVVSFAGALSGVAPVDRVGLMALHVVTGITVVLGGLLATRTVRTQTSYQERPRLEAGMRER
ncbi:MAG: DUF6069 family protein [Terracoccus sp.]